ncbi:MAG: M48 family metallopeptidase [Lachnospiraceae bacterium]|nr:M48 family metallopeptidase [Lachnospiraceae bacterium]
MKNEKDIIYIETASGVIPCRIVRSRRKSYGVVVGTDGRVEMRIPLRGSVKKAEEMVLQWADWIEKKVSLQSERSREKQKLKDAQEDRFTPAQREYLEQKYRKAAKEYIPGRARYFADILGVQFERVRIAEQKTRWGSCSGKGTLSFHWKLMLAPPKVLDYVIVHEVCHLKEMNHSPQFWAWVGFLMPDYKEQRKWLKEHGEKLQYY